MYTINERSNNEKPEITEYQIITYSKGNSNELIKNYFSSWQQGDENPFTITSPLTGNDRGVTIGFKMAMEFAEAIIDSNKLGGGETNQIFASYMEERIDLKQSRELFLELAIAQDEEEKDEIWTKIIKG